MRCRVPTHWARPARSSVPASSHWALSCTPSWACRWGRWGKVARFVRTTFGLSVTPGGLAHLLHRTARDAAPAYAALCQRVRDSDVVTADETGWRVGAFRHCLWVFATPETTVYAILPGRGFEDAARSSGPTSPGCSYATAGWRIAATTAQRTKVVQATCYDAASNCRRIIWTVGGPAQIQAVLQAGLDVRDRCNAGELSEHGLASGRGRLVARLGRLIDAPPPLDDAERFAKHSGHRILCRVPLLVGPVD